ncbi:MAG: glucose-6-phosphate isomerase [Nitrososphaeria archaeon]|nr:glucose-6-phosphate isomerase [Aigarchaeota archaeon]MCX8187988.1 glucose-6-phosphate isomerase [Nitrososphaeria archaeon]MDW8021184.1 glucose-6-phosphate isomerase family protein [Nitrososphaerota archaeon]
MSSETPFQIIKLDLKNILLKPAKHVREVKLSDMKEFFGDVNEAEKMLSAGKDPVIYKYCEFEASDVFGDMVVGLTVIYPGKVGREYFMTRGHFHERDSGEIYYCLRGSGMLLMQSKDGKVVHAELTQGNLCHVAPGWGHRTINTGRGRFIFLFFYPAGSGHNYGIIKEKGFAKLVVAEKGKPQVIDNPKYVAQQ